MKHSEKYEEIKIDKNNSRKTEIFRLIQKFLKKPPVIIWGSGATIPYGLPSMDDLKQNLKFELGKLDKDANLETKIGKIDNPDKINRIKKIIRNEIFKKNLECLKKSIQIPSYFEAIEKMISKFYEAQPQNINIITTNYDCILEYALSKAGYNFTDGFTGRSLSSFNSDSFGKKEIINIIKVHGSLNWFFDKNDNIFYLPCEYKTDNLKYAMVLPAKQRKSYEALIIDPYRTLIQKSDDIIKKANSFLVIGFGFNDDHLTPKIDTKIKKGTPVVIVTKKATTPCIKKLNNAEKYCLLEKNENGTKITFKSQKTSKTGFIKIDENYWELNKFMEVL